VPCILSDASHLSILERTHVDRSNLVVITVPDKDPAIAVVRNVRRSPELITCRIGKTF